MAIMDDAQANMGDMRDRFEELKQKDKDGKLDDAERTEMTQLRSRLFGSDDM